MRIFYYVLLLSTISFTLEAQQVKKIDCCQDVTPKATIIINENTNTGTTSSTTTNTTNPSNGVFNFELKSSLNTSAGVYNSSDVLIRTLWSGVRYDVGCYSAIWDGYLDDGTTAAPVGNYTIKILTNNVQYTWEGGIGDSSTEPLTNTKLAGNNYSTMVTVADKAFFSIGYSEHGTSERIVSLSDINKIIPFTGANTTTMNMLASCTDGNIVYFGGDKTGDPTNYYQTWVVGTYPADLGDPFKFIRFPARSTASYRGGSGDFDDQNAIAYSNNASSYINGMAVQRTGNFLFVLRRDLGQLGVYDKRPNSGALVKTNIVPALQDIAADDNGNLYSVSSPIKTGTATSAYVNANKVSGTPFSSASQGGTNAVNVFDGNFSTFFDANDGSSGYVGLDMGIAQVIKSVAYAPRSGLVGRLNGTVIQGSVDGSTYVNLLTISSSPENQYTTQNIVNTTAYRYYRAYSSGGGYTNISELAFFTTAFSIGNNPIITKYLVAADGTITDTGVSFSGVVSGSKIAYSLALNKLAVFDNSTSQVKIYNPTGGAPVQIVGNVGGYTTSPYFSSNIFGDVSLFYYQADGTLWVGQPGLYSLIHYNLDFTIKEQSQHRGSTHCVSVDQNNPDHIFGSYTEYVRDYSKPLDNGSNGSWKIYANWVQGKDVGNSNYDGLRWVGTLSNGRRYGIVRATGVPNKLYELTSTGLRLVLDYVGDGVNIGRDGTWYDYGDDGRGRGIYRKLLTGFDPNNNPVWSASVLWVANPPGSTYFTPWYGYQNKTSGLTAAADKYVYFNNGTTAEPGLDKSGTTIGYRLGAVKASTGLPVWKTARTTLYNYSGPYPANGDFDIGNNNGYQPQHSETYAMVYDDDIIQNVNGEFWQNGEANYFNHFNAATGLLIGHFGSDGNLAKIVPGAAGFSGNTISTTMGKANGNYYIYNDDESAHAFIHSWKVSGLNTVNITTVPITVTGAITLPADPTDMMAGVPFRSPGFYGGNGWVMNPAAYYNPGYAQYGDLYPSWRVTTTKNSYLKSDNDIYIESDGNAQGTFRTVSRTLGSNSSNNWVLSGSFKINSYTNSNYSLNIIDASGKVLAQIRTQYDSFYLNGNYYFPSDHSSQLSLNAGFVSFLFIPFVVKNVNGQVSVTINNYLPQNISSFDSGGNFNTPATFQVRAGGSGDQQHTLLSVKGLRFSVN